VIWPLDMIRTSGPRRKRKGGKHETAAPTTHNTTLLLVGRVSPGEVIRNLSTITDKRGGGSEIASEAKSDMPTPAETGGSTYALQELKKVNFRWPSTKGKAG